MTIIKKAADLTIRVKDFNMVATDEKLLMKLRSLTLHKYSGMNHELNQLLKIIKIRPVDCKIILGYVKDELVAWSMLSKEQSEYAFPNFNNGYNASKGVLFEVFVALAHRRKGIASIMMKVARRKVNGTKLCIVPWDHASQGFYGKFSNFNVEIL